MYATADAILPGRGHIKIPLGVALELPPGFEIKLRGRSGLAGKGILAHHGTIDNNYRGELAVHLYNQNDSEYHIKLGDRVCQIVIKPVPEFVMELADELSQTDRGASGFGSTGR